MGPRWPGIAAEGAMVCCGSAEGVIELSPSESLPDSPECDAQTPDPARVCGADPSDGKCSGSRIEGAITVLDGAEAAAGGGGGGGGGPESETAME